MSLEDSIRTFARKEVKIQVTLCTVASVYEDKATCDVITDEGVELFDVRLKSVITDGNEGVYGLPKVGSFVLVGIIKNIETQNFICGLTEVTKYVIKCSDDGVVELNGNQYETVKAKELKDELAKNNQLLQSIMAIINGSPIPETGGGIASSFQAALKVAIAGKAVGNFANINNNKVKHG